MEANKSSVNSFSSGKDRRRLYSWSRPSKQLPRQCKYDSETRICGAATLAFSPDLRWFQGNIISEAEEVYTITGRAKTPSTSDAGEADSSCFSHIPTAINITEDKLSPASQGYDEQCTPPSEGDLLDSELVRAALENLGLEEEELQYRVNIMDYETGTNHKLESVSCSIVSEVCSLHSPDLAFSSSSCSKGARADLVILRSIGQTLTDLNMLVFQGDITYTYDDLVCYPLESQSHGQWCL